MAGKFENIKELKKNSITVEFFFSECRDRFKFEKVTAPEINPDKLISEKDIHRPGLALAGYVKLFTYNRVQVFGNTEIRYLRQFDSKERKEILERIFSFDIPCIIVTNGNKIPEELIKIAEEKNVSVFKTPYPTTRLSYFISDFLDDQFTSQITIHGSFVDVYGVGLLFSGKSGIGKSEIALDLVERGHRLVTDDVVVVAKKGEGVLMGSGTALSKHIMEIRGLGIIDVKTIFGIRSIRYQKRVEVIVELEDWDKDKAYDRTGLDSSALNLLEVDVELIKLPIFPGKNITVIAEVIALNYLCKHYGYNAAEIFRKRLEDKINSKSKKNTSKSNNDRLERSTAYFEHDFE
ncbi:MAG TPA: HPr(Ser) kinase/phosphatase [Ignavibacteria bacterium]|nr:HPr(Ser) kinase/phosphatase [Ignavibacteria bacterium]HMR41528.1 HPr(Ser) kinase/phosphatase [Ignavibacteria bacterium]